MKQLLTSLGKYIAAFLRRLATYLNGTIDLKFLRHRFVILGLIGLVVLYAIIGGVVGYKVYKVKSESTNIRRILSIYPLPAVLLPTDVILVKDYLTQLKYIRFYTEKTKKPLPPEPELRAQLIGQMIDTRLLLHVTKQFNSQVTKADIDAAYKQVSEANGGPTELAKLLADLYGMNEKEFRNLIQDQLLRKKIQNEVLLQVKAKHILIGDEKKANEILEQIKKEPDKFDELAKANSEDTATRDNAGDLGFVARDTQPKPFEDALFKLKDNQVADTVIKTDFGFHIIKAVEHKGNIDKGYESFMSDLRKGKKIWVLIK
jgi:hypothetical protein